MMNKTENNEKKLVDHRIRKLAVGRASPSTSRNRVTAGARTIRFSPLGAVRNKETTNFLRSSFHSWRILERDDFQDQL